VGLPVDAGDDRPTRRGEPDDQRRR
jgi:hypothetical protein